MTNSIKFGTDGWRAIIAKDFTFDNVKLTTQAIACYIKRAYGMEKPLIIGYDTRFMAEKFAMFSAEILRDLGFKVLISNSFAPTPTIAYNAKLLNSAGALMFTASHNPPEYLGIKYIPDYAGPATVEITNEIIKNIGLTISNPDQKGDIKTFSPKENYFKQLETIIDFEKIKTANINICYDPLYATGQGFFDELLKQHGVDLKVIHNWRDVLYGGGMPEPKEKFLKEMQGIILENQNMVGFSNDGDADRFGVIDEKGRFITPNEVMAMLLIHLIKHKQAKGCLVKTVAASLMLDKIAQQNHIDVIETPVGFKWVGEAMRKNQTIIGGEESGGLSIGSHIPEKDGILANLLILEMMAYEGKPLFELVDGLKTVVNADFINYRIDLKLEEEAKNKAVDMFKNNPPKSFAGIEIKKIDKKDGIKFYLNDNTSWILVRPSGTEPLLRIYFETDNQTKLNSLVEFVKSLV